MDDEAPDDEREEVFRSGRANQGNRVQPPRLLCPSSLALVANEDHPPEKCSFGEHGWTDEDVNVLTAIMNMTQQVMDGRG